VEAALPAFRGAILQAPPRYSAIHINGKRAHELARAGVEPEMKARPVTIHRLLLSAWDPPHAELEVHCSSGAYIRSLARDLALAAGSRSHLRELTRLTVGNFSLEEALVLPEGPDPQAGLVSQEAAETSGDAIRRAVRRALRPLDPALFAAIGIGAAAVDEAALRSLSHGGDLRTVMAGVSVPDPPVPDAPVSGASAPGVSAALALFGPGNAFAALVERRNGRWVYGFVAQDAAPKAAVPKAAPPGAGRG
jgi:tRNA pseudouridine55 synthase